MKAYRFWTVAMIAALAACSNDNPTGLSHVDGPVINRVADLSLYKLQQLQIVAEDLTCEFVRFTDYAHGDVVSGTNLSPKPFGADIAVTVPFHDSSTNGEAWIYDTDKTDGLDADLEAGGQGMEPDLGRVMFLQTARDSAADRNGAPGDKVAVDGRPHDAYPGQGEILWTFPAIANVNWVIKSFTVLDQEMNVEHLELWTDGAGPVQATTLTFDGADAAEVVAGFEEHFNTTLGFRFFGSGAIDDIEVCQMVDRGGEGCTPGYWKQSQHFGSWSVNPYTTTFGDVFGDACALDNPELKSGDKVCDVLLLEALAAKGGGINALARHAAAAWLNTQSVDFHWTQAEVEGQVLGAFGTENYNSTKNVLAEANEAGCPLARDEGTWTP